MSDLALFGGNPAISEAEAEKADSGAFRWPVFGAAEEAAALAVLRQPNFFDDQQVTHFEHEFADWVGCEFGLAQSSGTNAVLAAMFACGVGVGDEVIAPTSTYWATCVQAYTLRASVVFADIDPLTLNVDVDDVISKITPRTKAVVVVHLLGYPVEMAPLVAECRRRNIKVIEDASHAHGSRYRGANVGTLGDIAAFSLCGKPIAVGEGGIIVTDDRSLFERAVAWGHHFRFNTNEVRDTELLRAAGLPLGGVTSRMHNISAAVGRTQLAVYPERMEEIDRAMTYFWDLMEEVPGVIAHRPPRDEGSTMGGWYCPHGIYDSASMGGLSAARYVEAVRAEGFHAWTRQCIKDPLHPHPLFHDIDVYREGAPTAIAHADRDLRSPIGSLPVAESVRAFTVPPFKTFDPAMIEQYVAMFAKVSRHAEELIPGDPGDAAVVVDARGNG